MYISTNILVSHLYCVLSVCRHLYRRRVQNTSTSWWRYCFDKPHDMIYLLKIQVCSHLLYASAPLCTKAFVLSRALLDHKLECHRVQKYLKPMMKIFCRNYFGKRHTHNINTKDSGELTFTICSTLYPSICSH